MQVDRELIAVRILKEKVDHILDYMNITKNYSFLKEKLREKQNFYVNYFYFFFGDHYESMINNANFFHFATESLILEIFKNKDKKSFDNDEMNKIMKSIDVDPISYYENIKLLTGSSYLYDDATKLCEMKISRIFLKNFQFFKEKYFNGENSFVGNFKTKFAELTQMAASVSLLELNILPIKNESKIKENLYYHSFHQMNNNIIMINFIENIQNEVIEKCNIRKQKNIFEVVKMYYFYCRTSFEEYMYDLELFNEHSTSIFEKIKKISLENFDNVNSKLNSVMTKSKTFEKMKTFYNFLNMRFSNDYVQCKIYSFKNWINSSIDSFPNFFSENYKISKLFLFNKVLTPSKNILIVYTDKYITFLITNLINVKKTMDEVSHFFLHQAEDFISKFENKINEKDLCIRFSSDYTINFVKIDLDNSLMMINSKKFKEYAENVLNNFNKTSFEFLEKSKNYLMNKFKLFFEDEINPVSNN